METLRYVVLVNALLAVVSVAYYVLLRRETFFRTNRLVLWLGLSATLLLPLLELPDWRPQPVRTVMHRTAAAIVPKLLPKTRGQQPDITITYPNRKQYPAFRNPPAESGWSWPMIALCVYSFGVALLLIRLGTQLGSLRKLIRHSLHESYVDFTLVRNEGVTSPFSFFNWVILNPDRHAPDELDQILRHERVHVRERHSLDMLGAELVCIVFWFNPSAYLFRHLLHQTLEFSADQAVLAEGVDAKAYQYHLVKVSLAAGQSAITNHFSKSQLKSRIHMINQPASSKIRWLKYPVLFTAVLMIVSAFARSETDSLGNRIPVATAERTATVSEDSGKVTESVNERNELPVLVNSLANRKIAAQPLMAEPCCQPVSFVSQQAREDTNRLSPSRYMMYKGDKLYWVITPKTSFDDLAIMKQEFTRHGYNMQVQTLKYDSKNTFISAIKIKIIRPVVGISDFEETGVGGGAIHSHGGYNGFNTLNTVAVVDSYPFDRELHIPEELLQIARDEELPASAKIDGKN